MKKLLFSLAILQLSLCSNAQNLITKVPFDASAVMKYAAGKLTQKVAISKMDSYEFIKSTLLKGIKTDSVSSIGQMGVDFSKDIFQYASFKDSANSLITLLPLNDAAQFIKIFNSGEKVPVEKKGYRFVQLSSGTYMGFSDSMAILIMTSYSSPNKYYLPAYDQSTADSTLIADSIIAATNMEGNMDIPVEVKPDDQPVKKTVKPKTSLQKGGTKKTIAKTKKPVKKGTKKPAPKYNNDDVNSDQTIESGDLAQQEEDRRREAWYAEQHAWAAAKQLSIADSLIDVSFNGSVTSIEKEESFVKLVDKSADMSVWLNYDNLLSQYWSFLFKKPGILTGFPKAKDTTEGTKTGVNIFFDQDKIRMEQKLYAGKDGKTFPAKAVYNSKQNTSFLNYINTDNIGYFSMSFNTEAMERYYYDAMKKYLGNIPYVSEYTDMVDVYVDLLDIIIDEKAIADLMPGNFLFVMHDLSPKTVTYKDYEYDKDFNQKEIEKTKTELAPDFTFVMETRNEKFLQKLVNLPVKYAERYKFNYKSNGDYYELVAGSSKYPMDTLFFAVKNGKAVITTLKSSIDITLNNTSVTTTDAATKNFVLNNNYAFRLNSKHLADRMAAEFNTDASKKIVDYLSNNLGDVTVESRLVDGMAVSSGTFNIKGQHSNSFEFFFNMINSINDIIEKDKAEKQPVQ